MKRLLSFLLAVVLVLPLTACYGGEAPVSSASISPSLLATPLATPTAMPTPTPMTVADVEKAAGEFPLKIRESHYILALESYESNAFAGVLENNSTYDILSAQVLLEAWDSNGLPVDLNYSNEYYGVVIYYDGINLTPNGVFSNAGYRISFAGASQEISSYKAVVLCCTTADGQTLENPYLEEWIACFDGKKLETSQMVFASPQELMEAGLFNGSLSAIKNIIPTAIAGGVSYGGTVTPTDSGFTFSYSTPSIYATGDDMLVQGYGNQCCALLTLRGGTALVELRDGLQKYCAVDSPVFLVNMVDDNGEVIYTEQITSEIIDTLSEIQ